MPFWSRELEMLLEEFEAECPNCETVFGLAESVAGAEAGRGQGPRVAGMIRKTPPRRPPGR
ncbi:hypothetical protein [Streptomyces diastatochromogenes]|uniref:hypothetical protein n=1 Tax=Streptomyces diastatochromogenes TaxID=42236 RepID=UPI000B91843C|nr:hypothetical protein [Streptomyces diastatochromogenes]